MNNNSRVFNLAEKLFNGTATKEDEKLFLTEFDSSEPKGGFLMAEIYEKLGFHLSENQKMKLLFDYAASDMKGSFKALKELNAHSRSFEAKAGDGKDSL